MIVNALSDLRKRSNSKPSLLKVFYDSIGGYFTIIQQEQKIRELISEENSQKAKFYFYTNNSLMFFVEFQSNKVNGNLIWFNKKGKVELIAKYKDAKLVGILFFRKKRNLEKYYKLFGVEAPVSILGENHTNSLE